MPREIPSDSKNASLWHQTFLLCPSLFPNSIKSDSWQRGFPTGLIAVLHLHLDSASAAPSVSLGAPAAPLAV